MDEQKIVQKENQTSLIFNIHLDLACHFNLHPRQYCFFFLTNEIKKVPKDDN